jgi:hypothetical protein
LLIDKEELDCEDLEDEDLLTDSELDSLLSLLEEMLLLEELLWLDSEEELLETDKLL